jgi:tRNA (guanine37-N1)-methyltransferase
VDDSFATGLLEFPHYTRPVEFQGVRVPDILLSGNHGAIAKWREEQALAKTRRLRPDLLPPA